MHSDPIQLFVTGGTFDKEYNELTGELFFQKTHIADMLRLGRCRLAVTVETLMMIDSLEMTDAGRQSILERCEASPAKRIVITHGTDTMVETGLYLQRTFPSLHVPVVLTGAMTPLGFEGSDGLQNLTESLMASRLLGPGVYIVMHGRVFPADHVRKDRDLGTFVETTQSVNPGGSE